jgi:hypothetical protein
VRREGEKDEEDEDDKGKDELFYTLRHETTLFRF